MKSAWSFLTRARAIDTDDARREYMTRVVLVMMALVGSLVFVVVVAGYISGDFGPDAPITITMMLLLIAVGWILTQIGKWRLGAIIPPSLFLIFGGITSYQYGSTTVAGLTYAIAIVLTAMLHKIWVSWLTLGFASIMDILILIKVYGATWADVGPTIIPRISMLLGLTLLQTFSSQLLENALDQASQANQDAELANQSLRQEAKERQKLIDELSSKNNELEQFTYTVSHDLKSPLVTIRGFLGLLEKDTLAGEIDRMRKDIQRIVTATNKMQRLLDELLELSRIGRIINPLQEVSFNTITNDAIENLQGPIKNNHVEVIVEESMPSVAVDRIRMVQALQNLIENAIKFMGDQENPSIKIGTAKPLTHNALPIHMRRIVFYIRDNGTGILPEYHERIFGLFNKLDVNSEGTGIGLALVKRIVAVHDGEIWVESVGDGHGTTFYISLPIAD